ncbi:ferrous iron transport protein B [Desulfofalx alkaliphila]|uniref:ferrous iron transport protein B n=1 Tax=Desulfofalx alkaliphila TaxID=105483 RepID=UPI0004E24C02|nr:ferrous iron transport protein B [Desulfofalx alkaliphila]
MKDVNIAIIGNPNVGKSVVFNYLTGKYVDVSNYPGTTMDVICGRQGRYIFTDTPGIYGLSDISDEERLARDIILRSDLVINVVDAVHLERDLFLTQQLIDTGTPIIVVLNMMDEAKARGIYIKTDVLEEELGVPVLPAVAMDGEGLGRLFNKISLARVGKATPQLQTLLGSGDLPTAAALMVAEGDREVAARYNVAPGTHRDTIYGRRRERINQVIAKTMRQIKVASTTGEIIGGLMLRPLTGIPLLLITLALMYLIIGVFVAQTVVDYTEGVLMEEYYEPLVRHLIGMVVAEDNPLWVLLVGRFGVLTMAVTLLFGLLLPLIVGLHLVLSALEDSGYLSRIAALLDRVLMGMGLNGQAVIPLILGFGCVTMATITTRMLGTDRERLITIFLLAFAVPCSAQLAIITGMLAGLGFFYMLAYMLIIFTAMVSAGAVLARVLPGTSSLLWIDLPPLRLPRLSNVLRKTWVKSSEFIREAAPLFAGSALVLGALDVTGGLEAIENSLVPLTVTWLGLPKEVAGSFIMGFIRREFGTAGLFTFPMSDIQKFIALTTLTFFVPCLATAMIIFKERGWKQGAAIWLIIFALAFIIGGIVAKTIALLGSIEGAAVMPMLAGLTLLILVLVMRLSWLNDRFSKM